MKKFITFAAWAIPVALLAWFAYTLIQNTKPQLQDKAQEICITVNFNNKPVEGTETVETTRQTCCYGRCVQRNVAASRLYRPTGSSK